MDKLYSVRSLIIKSVCCLLLGPLHVLISSVGFVENGFIEAIITIVPVGCLFTVPYWFTLVFVRKYGVKSLKTPLLLDLACCLLPAVLGVVITETVTVAAYGPTQADGFITAVFAALFAVIDGIFALACYIASRK